MKKFAVYSLLMFFCVCACKSKKEQPKQKAGGQATVVDVIVATPTAISSKLEVNGTIVANEFVELRPELSGRLTYLNVPEGKYVTKGTVIARVTDADLRAQLQKLRVQLQLAQTTVQRYRKLLDINGINRADYDVAVNQVSSTQADISATEVQITRAVVRAPFSGVVGLRQVSPGALVSPATVLATMQQVDKVKLDFTVPEEYGNIIHKGDYVTAEVDAATHEKQRAKIIAIEPQANTATRNIQVRASLEGKANPGAFVKVYLTAGTDKNGIMVPASAIIPEDKDKTLVTVKQGKAKYVKVETGVRQAANIEVTSGIQQGDTIVVSGVLFTKPNGPVKVRSVKKIEQLAANNEQ